MQNSPNFPIHTYVFTVQTILILFLNFYSLFLSSPLSHTLSPTKLFTVEETARPFTRFSNEIPEHEYFLTRYLYSRPIHIARGSFRSKSTVATIYVVRLRYSSDERERERETRHKSLVVQDPGSSCPRERSGTPCRGLGAG